MEDKRKKHWKKSNQNKLDKIKQIVKKFKDELGGKCEICGEDRYHVLEFHHENPNEKEDNVPTLLRYYGYGEKSINKVKEEVKKCKLLCANCHKDVHYNLQQTITNGGIYAPEQVQGL
jgi:5-methylcytosine-specific restriction endonuclease McrA